MNTKKLFAFALGGGLLAGCLTVYRTAAESIHAVVGDGAAGAIHAVAGDGAEAIHANEKDGAEGDVVSCAEQFKPYEQFGLIYDADKNELQYNGRLVRWFEDYYSIGDGMQAGKDFLNENGVVDVYAVRDRSDFARSNDGSFDPGGKLIGVKEFTAEEFAARDIGAIKNSSPVAVAGDLASAKEVEDVAKEYEAFGVTYDAKNDQWYYNGEKVRLFRDVLTSNGESLTGGKFRGSLRTFRSEGGSIDIYTVRDFANPDISGNGTLTGIQKFSQTEFDEHTDKEAQTSSGFCTVN